jgi:hypothetical protein
VNVFNDDLTAGSAQTVCIGPRAAVVKLRSVFSPLT